MAERWLAMGRAMAFRVGVVFDGWCSTSPASQNRDRRFSPLPWLLQSVETVNAEGITVGAKARTPNSTLRRIREQERHESREEFARAVVATARRLGEASLACDARLVGRWEDGDVRRPRPIYQRVLSVLLDRPFEELGFAESALALPSDRLKPSGVSLETIDFQVDEKGQVWAEVNRRSFLLGSAASLIQAAGGFGRVGISAQQSTPPTGDPFGFAAAVQQICPGVRLSRPVPDYGVDWTMLLPGGRALDGASAALQVHEAHIRDGLVLVDVSDRGRWREFTHRAGRGLLIGADATKEEPRLFAIDAREARRTGDGPWPVSIPAAYELDDISYAILWAAANLDDGLQADDRAIAASRTELAPYEQLPASAVSRDAAPDLTTVAHMWLGSDFCARHILRHLDELPDRPVFWTREQRGEEGSMWLLFGHKYEYLRRTQDRAAGDRLVRAFCVPELAVQESPRHERILLLLAASLMESCNIEVKLTTDPAYADVDGFVLGGTQRAVVANWVRSDGMWRVDATERRSTLAEYADASGHVQAHSAIDAPSPEGRLQAFAAYLELDLAWLRRRCRELGRYGTAGLVRPRSRLIATTGLDAACGYVGSLAVS